jgi:hypothetical protein
MTTRPTLRSRSKSAPTPPPTLEDVVATDAEAPPNDMPLPEPIQESTDVKFTGERRSYPSRQARIELLAYLLAERRGFESGHELDDWLAAEQAIDWGESDPRMRD